MKFLAGTSIVVGTAYYCLSSNIFSQMTSTLSTLSPKQFPQGERLVVKKLSDSLDMYRRSIGNAMEEAPAVVMMRRAEEKTISELDLTKAQMDRLKSAQEKYRQRCREATAALAEKLTNPQSKSNRK
jgi:hypothetical protein